MVVTRAKTIMGQIFCSLEYGNCRDLASMRMQCLVNVNFEEKNSVLSIEKFQFLVLARDTIMLQQLSMHFSFHFLSSGRLREVRNKGKFQYFNS